MRLKKITPILWTKDLAETVSFYTDKLGFVCTHQIDRFAIVARDEVEIMTIVPIDEPDDCNELENKEPFFSQPNFTGSLYIDTENVDELWKQVKDKVRVKYGIGNREWGVGDFSILDNNGYEVVFGQDINDTAITGPR